jgi:hypothetical protein
VNKDNNEIDKNILNEKEKKIAMLLYVIWKKN